MEEGSPGGVFLPLRAAEAHLYFLSYTLTLEGGNAVFLLIGQ